MTSLEITVIAKISARAGKERETLSALTGLLDPTRQEDGCLQYDLHTSPHTPNQFLFVERWTSEAALAKHAESAHIQALRARGEELLAAPTEITIWKDVSKS